MSRLQSIFVTDRVAENFILSPLTITSHYGISQAWFFFVLSFVSHYLRYGYFHFRPCTEHHLLLPHYTRSRTRLNWSRVMIWSSLSLSVVCAHGTLTHFNEWKGLHFIPFASGFHSPKRSQNEHRVCEVVKRTQTINKTPRLGERVINSPLRGIFFYFCFFTDRTCLCVVPFCSENLNQPTGGEGRENSNDFFPRGKSFQAAGFAVDRFAVGRHPIRGEWKIAKPILKNNRFRLVMDVYFVWLWKCVGWVFPSLPLVG